MITSLEYNIRASEIKKNKKIESKDEAEERDRYRKKEEHDQDSKKLLLLLIAEIEFLNQI